MRWVLPKIIAALTAGVVGIGAILFQQYMLKKNFKEYGFVNAKFQKIHADLIYLQHTILESSYFLYFNNDVIYKKSDEIQKELDSLATLVSEKRSAFPLTLAYLQKMEKLFNDIQKKIDTFLTLNASLKNSSIYLPIVFKKAYSIFDVSKKSDRDAILLLSNINADMFLTKNALDESFIEQLSRYKKSLGKIESKLPVGRKRVLLATALRHLEIFVRYFPLFHRTLEDILDTSIIKASEKSYESYNKESARQMKAIDTIGNVFLLAYLVLVGIVIYFILQLQRENILLKRLRNKLENSLTTDPLTDLPNRIAFKNDKNRYRHPTLVLVNIDRFKHINDFYGTDMGDMVLKNCAKRLETLLPEIKNARLYRLGGDDFGILFESGDIDMADMSNLLENIVKRCTEKPFELNDMTIDISVTIGASTQEDRLFETADMALKFAKNSSRHLFAIYEESMDQKETIEKNIKAISRLKNALANDRVFPYFQPIVDLGSMKTVKYEALARMEDENGAILPPYQFLEAAKQAKLSGSITTAILERTLEMVHRSGASFSVNISSSDIANIHDKEQIYELLEKNSDIAGNITFEILESEEIEDYEVVSEFLKEVRRYGCKIAIDDFGSGYSNFEKLLQLEIDYLKIDGSLIKNIDHDAHAKLVAKTVAAFAKEAKIETVAEFIHSKSVLEEVASIGMNFGQGYHLGKPMPAIHYFKNDMGISNTKDRR
ncbi:EAL domain-containing protein [Hydrogenimonas sp.]